MKATGTLSTSYAPASDEAEEAETPTVENTDQEGIFEDTTKIKR